MQALALCKKIILKSKMAFVIMVNICYNDFI